MLAELQETYTNKEEVYTSCMHRFLRKIGENSILLSKMYDWYELV